ncbi:MAG: alpha/beta fold hydrolase [Actinomycetota bacterium]|nr:alpha/beta fold hydrolase [Actinomycetota bacterium]
MADSTTTVAGSGGLELAVHEWGDPARPTIVLVHGFPDSSSVWIPVAQALVDHGFHVAAHDVRGTGGSEAPSHTSGYELEHLVADIRAVADAVSPDQPVHLVGHDWGSIQGWEAACSEVLDGRLLSYTSISAPPLDHAGHWMRARREEKAFGALLQQGLRSAYIPFFHLPGVQAGAERIQGALTASRKRFGKAIARRENARVDGDWPASTFGRDVANGMELYRANVRDRLARPNPLRARVPVQLIVAVHDPWVPPSLLDGLEDIAPDLRRRNVDAGHWVIRSQPVDVAVWITEFVESLDEVPGS